MGARDIAVNILERVQGSGAISRVEGDLKKLGPAGNLAASGMDRFSSFLTGRLGIASGAAKKGLDGLTTSALGTGTALSGGVVAGAAAGVAAAATLFHVIKDGVADFVNLTSQARAVQRVTGATAQDASTLAAVMRELGIDVGAATTFFGRLEKNIGTNEAALTKLGITVARDADGNTDFFHTLLNISDAYRGHSDQATKAAIASAAFGRGYIELLPILGKSREQLAELAKEAEKHHLVFDQSQLEAGKDLQLSVRNLHGELTGLSAEVGSAVVPALTDFVAGLTEIIEKADQVSHTIGRGLGLNLIPKEVRPALFGLVGLVSLLGHHSSEAGKQQAELTQEMEDAAKAADAEKKALADLNTQAEAPLKLADANERLAQAVQKLHDAEAEDPAADLRQATDDLTAARDRHSDAVEREQDAEKTLNGLIRGSVENVEALTRAQHELEHASTALADAQDRQKQAQAEVNRILGDSASTPDQIAEATQTLRDANDDVTSAQDNQADAQKKVNDLQNPEATKEYRDAVRGVRDAQREVATSSQAIVDAQKKVDDLHRVDKANDVRVAERGVEEASYDVAKAAGDSASDQIKAWQSIDTFLTQNFGPRFHQFVVDRETDLDTFNGKIAETNQGLQGLLGIISGATSAPAPAAGGASNLAPLFPGVPAPAPTPPSNLGDIYAPAITPTAPTPAPGDPQHVAHLQGYGSTTYNTFHVSAPSKTADELWREMQDMASRRALMTA